MRRGVNFLYWTYLLGEVSEFSLQVFPPPSSSYRSRSFSPFFSLRRASARASFILIVVILSGRVYVCRTQFGADSSKRPPTRFSPFKKSAASLSFSLPLSLAKRKSAAASLEADSPLPRTRIAKRSGRGGKGGTLLYSSPLIEVCSRGHPEIGVC